MQNKLIATAFLSLLALNPALAQAEGKDGVAAVVNGEEITIEEMKQGYKDNKPINSQIKFEQFYDKALDIYVNGKLLYQAAEESGVMKDSVYERSVNAAKEEIARKMYLEKMVDEKVSDSDIKKLYNEYKSTFKSEKEVKAKHILVEDESTAKNIIAKLKKGEKFDDLAKEYSKDSAVDLGYFTRNMMVPEFSDAAFALKKGSYSQKPVKTQFGYHVILVEDSRNAKPLPLETVKPQLKAMLSQNAVADVFKDIYEKAKVTKYSLDGKEIKDPVVMPKTPAVK